MNDSPDTLERAADNAAPSAPPDENVGWYLYGVTHALPGAGDDIGALVQTHASEHVELMPSGDVLAIVRRVPLDDFSPEALSASAEDPAWIEAAARQHNAVIAAVHQMHTILPAKFGSVYARAADLQTALRDEQDALLAHLSRLADSDEWGIRLYADAETIRQRADVEQESMQRLRQDLASASPGRAYFLQRKREDELTRAVDALLDDLVERAFAELGRHARAAQVSGRLSGARIAQERERAEVLRAAFLVARESASAFIEEVHRFSESEPGLWCEYSGPWPPYSFAAVTEPQARPRE